DHGAGLGREDLQDEVRPPRCEPPGQGPRFGPRLDHQPEPRLRGRRENATRKPARHARVALRRHAAGPRAHRQARVLLPGAPGSQPGPARHRLPVRPLRRLDGEEVSMAKRTDIHSVLIIGAGPIIIGQACEFDYSGVQACKALREEGYKVILINSNPATIMTDPATADVTYIEPITWQTVEKIIAKERPDAILPTMGGQTALNCALDLWHHGVLEKYRGAAT